MAAGECPSRADLSSMLDGVDPAREQRLAAHLEDCDSCRQVLDALAGEERLTVTALRTLADPIEADSPSLSQVVARFERSGDSQSTRFDTSSSHNAPAFLLDPPDDPDSIGRLGRFKVLRQLGRGGMGVVFLAVDPMLDRQVAVKVLNPQFIGDEKARDRFQREARRAAAINHANLVTIYSVEMAASNLLLVMEYIDGVSLQDRLRQDGTIALPELIRIGIQVSLGLAAAHARGLVHRDIKPGNILIARASNQAKIADFGLAQAVDDPEINSLDTIQGTPAYMAPEQAQGLEVDHRADLFSLGSVFFAMCTGHPPFDGSTLSVIRQVAEHPPRTLHAVDPEAPAWLVELVSRLHAFEPDVRITSATDVARILKQQLDLIRHPNAAGGSTGSIPHAAATLEIGVRAIDARLPEQAVSAPPPPLFTPLRLTINPSTASSATAGVLSAATLLSPPSSSSPATPPAGVSAPVLPPPVTPPPLPDPVETFEMPVVKTAKPRPRKRTKTKSREDEWRKFGAIAALLALVAIMIGVWRYLNSPAQGAFVILGSDGNIRGRGEDLADAVSQAKSGDTIEIQGSRTFTLAAVQIRGKSLTIKAAPQSQPQLSTEPKATAAWIDTDSPLTLEGLDLVNPRQASDVAPSSMIDLHNTSLRIGGCRLVHQGTGPLLLAEGSSDVDLRRSLVISSAAACIETTSKQAGAHAKITAEDSIFAGSNFLAVRQNVGVRLDTEVRLRRDSIVVHEGFRLHGVPDSGKFDWQLHAHVNSQYNLYDADRALFVLQFDGMTADDALRIGRMSRKEADSSVGPAWQRALNVVVKRVMTNVRRSITVQSQNDLRGGPGPLMALASGEPPGELSVLGSPAAWSDWAQIWAEPTLPMPYIPSVIEGVSLRKHVETDALNVQASEFRRSAAKRFAGVKVASEVDEGAAAARVGPGNPYEAWKKNPDYAEWKKRGTGSQPTKP